MCRHHIMQAYGLASLLVVFLWFGAMPTTQAINTPHQVYMPLIGTYSDVEISWPRMAQPAKGWSIAIGTVRNLSDTRTLAVTISVTMNSTDTTVVGTRLSAILPQSSSPYYIQLHDGVITDVRVASVSTLSPDIYAPLQIEQAYISCKTIAPYASVSGLVRNTTDRPLTNLQIIYWGTGYAEAHTLPNVLKPDEAAPFSTGWYADDSCNPFSNPPTIGQRSFFTLGSVVQ